MAITSLTASSKVLAPSSATTAAKTISVPGAASAPAAPTGKVSGAFDLFRSQRPSDIPEDWWNQYIDTQNSSYQRYITEHPNEKGTIDKQLAAYTIDQIATAARATTPKDLKLVGGAYAPTQDLATAQANEQRDDTVQQIIDLQKQAYEDNKGFVDSQVVPSLDSQRVAAAFASGADASALEGIRQAGQTYKNQYADLAKRSNETADRFNDLSGGLYDQMASTYSGLDASDRGALSRFDQETDPLTKQLTAQGSDPNDVAAQSAALAQAARIASGDLNYDAETYESNAEDVARQQGSFNDLQGVGYGALDYESEAAKAYADAGDVANQRKALADIQKDVASGDKEQRDLYDLMRSRTGVEQTAEERALYELNRRKAEADQRSAGEAVLENQKARGVRSGGAEIAQQATSNAQIAQDRLLQDMLANAGAVKRAQEYTQMAGNEANQMRASNQQGLGLQADLSTALRDASFDEAYKRGVGADTASANNQGTRLSGLQGAGSLATAMRNASDQVGLTNAGFVNEAQANNQQTMLGGASLQANQSNALRSANDTIRMFQDNYAQNEAKRVADVAGQRLGATTSTNQGIGVRASDLNQQGQQMLDTNYAREKDAIGADATSADKGYSTDQDYYKGLADVGQRNYDRAAGVTGAATNVAGVRSGINQTGANAVSGALSTKLSADDLAAALKKLGY